MIVLKLTDEQAKIASKACEFYARMKMGQFMEVIHNCMDVRSDNFCQRRDCAEKSLLLARTYTHPELEPTFGHSHGIGKFVDADMAYDVHQVIRFAMGGKEPFSYNPLPICEKVGDDK